MKKEYKLYIKSLKCFADHFGQTKEGYTDVLIGSMKVKVQTEDIEYIPKNKTKIAKFKNIAKTTSNKFYYIDLHGYKVTDAIILVENKISECIIKGLSVIIVIHGKGSGRIKAALHEYLASSPVVARYNESSQNTGETVIYLNKGNS
jgi:DNA mismatch repair protein MutS2